MDDREKKPLRFPLTLPIWDPSSLPTSPRRTTVRLITRSARLETADYQLAGFEGRGAIERKASLRELHNNLCSPVARPRFIAELLRLKSDHTHPLLLIEGDPLSLTTSCPPELSSIPIRDLLFALSCEHRIPFLFLPCSSATSRQEAVAWAAAYLIAAALSPSPPA